MLTMAASAGCAGRRRARMRAEGGFPQGRERDDLMRRSDGSQSGNHRTWNILMAYRFCARPRRETTRGTSWAIVPTALGEFGRQFQRNQNISVNDNRHLFTFPILVGLEFASPLPSGIVPSVRRGPTRAFLYIRVTI